jgi:hypothetical protein
VPGELRPFDVLDVEAGACHRRAGIAVQVAIAGHPAVERCQPLLPAGDASAATDVFEEHQLSIRLQDPARFGQNRRRLVHRAEHEGEDSRIEALVGERQLFGASADDLDGHARLGDLRRQPLCHALVGLDRDDATGPLVVREVGAGPGADLDDVALEIGEQAAAVIGVARPLGPAGHEVVQLAKSRLRLVNAPPELLDLALGRVELPDAVAIELVASLPESDRVLETRTPALELGHDALQLPLRVLERRRLGHRRVSSTRAPKPPWASSTSTRWPGLRSAALRAMMLSVRTIA